MFLQKIYTLISDLITIFNVVLNLVIFLPWPDLEVHFLPETPPYKKKQKALWDTGSCDG